MAMDEGECLHRYGLRPVGEVRGRRRVHIRLERQAQGDGDTELMKLGCVQLFNAGSLDDVLLIWMAKCVGMDADCSIHIQLLYGSGLAGTKAYPFSQCLPEAEAACRCGRCARSTRSASPPCSAAMW